jgi:hypothetical protein
MSHRNAPLTPEGRRRLCERVDTGRPISHVAAEAGIARQTLGKWYGQLLRQVTVLGRVWSGPDDVWA